MINARRITIAGAAVAAITLAACSSDKKEGDGSTTTSIEPTTTIVETTTLPSTTTTEPATPTTAAPTTAPAPTTTAVASPAYALYEQVDRPDVPSGHTDPFTTSGVLADGVYWVSYNGGETTTPDISVFQAFFGDECVSKAAEIGDECNNDYLVVADPTRDIDDLPFAGDVFLTVADVNSQLSYWITPDELVTIRASSPSAGAPADFSFTPFPFIMTVDGGQIVAFEQLWVP